MLKVIAALSLVLVACTDAAPTHGGYTAIPTSPSAPTKQTAGALAVTPDSPTVTAIAHDGVVTLDDHQSLSSIDSPDPCTMTTQELDQWIEDTLGCGIMVDFVCAGGMRAGFVTCQPGSAL